MARRFHYKRRKQGESFDTDIMHVLNLTPMMDILTVLVIFLLVTAVFLSITVMELSIPTSGAAAAGKQNVVIEVIIRRTGLQISNGSRVEAAIPIQDGSYDVELLSKMLVRLKEQFPGKQDATVLMEPAIEYDKMIQVMDAVRSADVRAEGSSETKKVVLFPDISIGDAP